MCMVHKISAAPAAKTESNQPQVTCILKLVCVLRAFCVHVAISESAALKRPVSWRADMATPTFCCLVHLACVQPGANESFWVAITPFAACCTSGATRTARIECARPREAQTCWLSWARTLVEALGARLKICRSLNCHHRIPLAQGHKSTTVFTRAPPAKVACSRFCGL